MSTGKPEQSNPQSNDGDGGLNPGRSDQEDTIRAMAGHFKLPAAFADELVRSRVSEDAAARQILTELESRQPDSVDHPVQGPPPRPEVAGEWDLAGLLALAYWAAAKERAEAGLPNWSAWNLQRKANRPRKPSDPGRVLSEVYESSRIGFDCDFGEFAFTCRLLYETRVGWPLIDPDCPDPEAYSRIAKDYAVELPTAWGKIDAGVIRTVLENRGLWQPQDGADAPRAKDDRAAPKPPGPPSTIPNLNTGGGIRAETEAGLDASNHAAAPELSNCDVPQLDVDSSDWTSRSEAAKLLGVKVRTLQNRAGRAGGGRKSLDGLSGVDKTGLQWRKKTKYSRCWCYKPTPKPTLPNIS